MGNSGYYDAFRYIVAVVNNGSAYDPKTLQAAIDLMETNYPHLTRAGDSLIERAKAKLVTLPIDN